VQLIIGIDSIPFVRTENYRREIERPFSDSDSARGVHHRGGCSRVDTRSERRRELDVASSSLSLIRHGACDFSCAGRPIKAPELRWDINRRAHSDSPIRRVAREAFLFRARIPVICPPVSSDKIPSPLARSRRMLLLVS